MQKLLFPPKHNACFVELPKTLWRSTPERKAMSYFSKTYDIPIVSPSQSESFAICFFSLHSFRDVYGVAAAAQNKRPGQTWIAGGGMAANPVPIRWIMDYVFVGHAFYCFDAILNGDRDLEGMLDCRKGDSVTYHEEPLPDAQIVPREFILSSGCKRRCLFCVHPWRDKFQEQPRSRVESFLSTFAGRSVWLSSNLSTDVSYYNMIHRQLVESEVVDRSMANTLDNVSTDMLDGRKTEVFSGIEGMSEKLRSIVNKPLKQTVLRDTVLLILRSGVKSRTVYQFNLPGETESDFDEWLSDVRHVYRHASTGGYHATPFIPHHPSSHTPMQWETPTYSIEQYRRLREQRDEWQARDKRMDRASQYMPHPMQISKFVAEVLPEYIPITAGVLKAVRSLPQHTSLDIQLEHLESHGIDGRSIFCPKPRDYEFPWDYVKIRTSKTELLRRADAMHKRLAKFDRKCKHDDWQCCPQAAPDPIHTVDV